MTVTEWLRKNYKWVALGVGVGIGLTVLYWLLKRPPEEEVDPMVRFGMVADTHNNGSKRADVERQNCVPWLRDFVNEMNEWKPDFIIQLGDIADVWEEGVIVDQAELYDRIKTAMDEIRKSVVPYYSIHGNHEIPTSECSKTWVRPLVDMPSNYYSFDIKRFHFIVLDPFDYEYGYVKVYENFRIYPEERDWLINELETVKKPTLFFIHVPLSGFFEGAGGHAEDYNSMRNGAEIRSLLEGYEQVIAVFEAHYHNPDGDTVCNGLSYMWKEGRIPYFGVYSLVDQTNLKSRGKVTLNAETRKGVYEALGAKPRTFEWEW